MHSALQYISHHVSIPHKSNRVCVETQNRKMSMHKIRTLSKNWTHICKSVSDRQIENMCARFLERARSTAVVNCHNDRGIEYEIISCPLRRERSASESDRSGVHGVQCVLRNAGARWACPSGELIHFLSFCFSWRRFWIVRWILVAHIWTLQTFMATMNCCWLSCWRRDAMRCFWLPSLVLVCRAREWRKDSASLEVSAIWKVVISYLTLR